MPRAHSEGYWTTGALGLLGRALELDFGLESPARYARVTEMEGAVVGVVAEPRRGPTPTGTRCRHRLRVARTAHSGTERRSGMARSGMARAAVRTPRAGYRRPAARPPPAGRRRAVGRTGRRPPD